MEVDNKVQLNWGLDKLEALFPFYLYFDENFILQAHGRSIGKIFNKPGLDQHFLDAWEMVRPGKDEFDKSNIRDIVGRYILFINKHNPELQLKGQFEYFADESKYLFFGTPLFLRTNDLVEFDLKLHDFANHDSLIDMLQILNQYEMSNQELQDILNENKLVNKQLRVLTSLINNSSDAIQISRNDGQFFFVNQTAADRLGIDKSKLETYYVQDIEKIFQTPGAWEKHVEELRSTDLMTIEGINENQLTGKIIPVEVTVKLVTFDEEEFVVAIARDITERKLNELVHERQVNQARHIISSMNLGLVELDLDNTVIYWNQQFKNICNCARPDISGIKITQMFDSFDPTQDVIRELGERNEALPSYQQQVRIFADNGRTAWWLMSLSPKFDEKNELVGKVAVILDISEQKILEDNLERALAAEQMASAAKENFLTNMSHEMRTPLNGVIGMLRQIDLNEVNTTQHIFVDSAQRAARHMLSIINNILDITKIESGELKLIYDNFSISDVLRNIESIVSPSKEKPVDFIIEKDNVEEWLVGDETIINQILINILGNAMKFTEEGSVKLKIQGGEIKNRKQALRMTVEDTGVGMSEAYVQDIFKKFHQEQIGKSRKFGGTGLGMYITKRFVDLLGGSISVKSTKGLGTTITIDLELELGVPNLEEQQKDFENLDFDGKKVLLVEDNEINIMVATYALQKLNLDVTNAMNGKDALQQIEKDNFDLILMDIQMPEMDGIEATQIIRKELKSDIPIIGLSANAFKTEIESCLQKGMNDYITKPFEESDLAKAISKYLTFEVKPEQDKFPNEKEVFDSQEKLYDLAEVEQICGNDPELIKSIIGSYLEVLPEEMEKINAAEKANDRETVKNRLHYLKSNIHTLKIDSIISEVDAMSSLEMLEWEEAKYQSTLKQVLSVLQLVYEQLKADNL